MSKSNQNDKKHIAALEAIKYIPINQYIGIGTGSTVNYLIEALATIKDDIKGVVSSSQASTELLKKVGINIVSLNETGELSVYIDGADEINHSLQMIKGGGGALLKEKIVAAASKKFICIADETKYVQKLGKFPVAVEVIPDARSFVARKLLALGGIPEYRIGFITDSGNEILDVRNFDILKPRSLEEEINKIPGVVENGLFASYPAHLLILGSDQGVKTFTI